MNNCERNIPKEIPKNIKTKDGITISHEFQKNRFLESDNLQLKKEDGTTLDTQLVTTVTYKKKDYAILSPKKDAPFEFTHVFIAMETRKKEDNNTTYLPVEDDKTLIAIAERIIDCLEMDEEEKFSRIIKNFKKNNFSI